MILDRIKQYIDFKGISIASFERSIGMSNASFRKSLNNKKAIGTDKLENILTIYRDISPSWLLYGVGEMIKNEKEIGPDEPISQKELWQKLLDQAEEIGRLKEQLSQLQKKLDVPDEPTSGQD